MHGSFQVQQTRANLQVHEARMLERPAIDLPLKCNNSIDESLNGAGHIYYLYRSMCHYISDERTNRVDMVPTLISVI